MEREGPELGSDLGLLVVLVLRVLSVGGVVGGGGGACLRRGLGDGRDWLL